MSVVGVVARVLLGVAVLGILVGVLILYLSLTGSAGLAVALLVALVGVCSFVVGDGILEMLRSR